MLFRSEKLKEMMGVDESVMNSSIRPAAEYQVKNDLLLDAVVEAEKLEASAEEIEEFVKKMAEGFGAKVEELKNYFGEEMLAEEVKKEKAGKLIVDSAVVAAPAAAEEKPAPKKRASKKAAPKAAEGEEKPAEEKPAPKKRASKKAAPKAEESEEPKAE